MSSGGAGRLWCWSSFSVARLSSHLFFLGCWLSIDKWIEKWFPRSARGTCDKLRRHSGTLGKFRLRSATLDNLRLLSVLSACRRPVANDFSGPFPSPSETWKGAKPRKHWIETQKPGAGFRATEVVHLESTHSHAFGMKTRTRSFIRMMPVIQKKVRSSLEFAYVLLSSGKANSVANHQ